MKIKHLIILVFMLWSILTTFFLREAGAGGDVRLGMRENSNETFPSLETGKTSDEVQGSDKYNEALGCFEDFCTIFDQTLVQRWELDQPVPGGTPPDGWYDVIGDDVFNTFCINVMWSGDDVHFVIFTNFPATGYGDGTPIGYPTGGFWQVADLALDLDRDGFWEIGIALIDHGPLPHDPSYPDPPGYGLPADNFMKGEIYSVSAWFSPDDIHYYHSGRGGRYDVGAPKIPPVWMRLGEKIGVAEVTWTNLGGTDPTYRIDVIVNGLNSLGQWDDFGLLWATGNCANDVIVGSIGPVVPDIKVNGSDGPVIVTPETPVSVTVGLDPGCYEGIDASWWVVASTPFPPPEDWYSYVYPLGWFPGILPAAELPLFHLGLTELLSSTIPPGYYIFFFAVRDNRDGSPHTSWLDYVEVTVE